MDSYSVYISVEGKLNEAVRIAPSLSIQEIRSVFCAAADVSYETRDIVLKLYRPDGILVPIGPHIPPNSPETRYILQVKQDKYLPGASLDVKPVIDALDAVSALLGDALKLKDKVDKLKRHAHAGGFDVAVGTGSEELTNASKNIPAIRRVKQVGLLLEETVPKPDFSDEVKEHLKHPTFDIWQWQEHEMAYLLEHMLAEFGLIELYKIDETKMRRFLQCVRCSYNNNPFHNFRHCFCVTQMMYGLLHVTGVHEKLTPLEKLVLIVACIGHDLDHPGFNNAYQINASTELSIIYNDISPLENHHAAVLFTILKSDETNILSNLPSSEYREARKQIINCILATDMARHGELMAKFKGYAEAGFSYEDPAQRALLIQMIVKCADISNEVRPQHVSEPWVDSLLEEFFAQSDREKAEGLPWAPFMDRQKVTKASAQVGFIGFVMIPLFELVSKVLPNMEEPVIQPIRRALDYYKSMTG
ncbi:hypothetical protein SpCBS45565_g05142 [Spizellomyces sp. 'palustris']|nr:hypothetical protein SpCBS45565_g05142 [Spizellomyces sp. 'palustris']